MNKIVTDADWKANAQAIAIDIVLNVSWPWTERQKRLWYIGVLCDMFTRKALEEASIEQLQDWHREVIH